MYGGAEGILALTELARIGVILICLAGVWYIYSKFIPRWQNSGRWFLLSGFGLPILAGGAACLILRDWRWGLVFASPLIIAGVGLFSFGLFVIAARTDPR
jgi:4-hydroxybenzoate polyprenyltransferase